MHLVEIPEGARYHAEYKLNIGLFLYLFIMYQKKTENCGLPPSDPVFIFASF